MLNIDKLENLYINGTLSEYLNMCSINDLNRLVFMVSDSHLSRNSKQSILGIIKWTIDLHDSKIINQKVA